MTVRLNEPITSTALSSLVGCSAPKTETLIRSVVTDAREASREALFCALPGHVTDGHCFIPQAIERGCSAVLCAAAPNDTGLDTSDSGSPVAFLTVNDVNKALFKWAKAVRNSFYSPVIAITGSVGKTTCKEFLSALLSPLGNIFSTPGNHNSTVGVPLSLLRLGCDDKAAVVELGMNHAGEISALSELVRPDVGVITTVGRAHIGLLGSEKAVFNAKCEIADGMNGGAVWVPAYDRRFDNWSYPHQITFGEKASGADCRYRCVPSGKNTDFSLVFPDGERLVGRLPFAQPITAEAALRTAAVAHGMGVSDKDLLYGLAHLMPPPSRMEITEYCGITLIDDSYNAAPEAMQSALTCLGKYTHGRRFAILGEMGELGIYAKDIHYDTGRATAQAFPFRIWYKGRYADAFLQGCIDGGLSADTVTIINAKESISETAGRIRVTLQSGDVLLIKGAHETELYKLAPLILRKKD